MGRLWSQDRLYADILPHREPAETGGGDVVDAQGRDADNEARYVERYFGLPEGTLPKKGNKLMRPQITRCFRISDALALVAATALGLAGCRLYFSPSDIGWGNLWHSRDSSVLVNLWMAVMGAIPAASMLLLSWTTAVLLLRLRTPRPRRRRLWCQPGFLACVAAVFVFAWKCIGIGILLADVLLSAGPAGLSGTDYETLGSELVLMLLSSQYPFAPPATVGKAVLLVWLVTWASGRCRAERSWVDRCGRFLGAVWVCIGLLMATLMLG